MLVAAAGVAGPDLGVLANYGVLGLFTGILLWFALRAWQREIARAERLESELRDQHQIMVEKVVPALVSAANALNESAQLARDLADEQQEELRRRAGVAR